MSGVEWIPAFLPSTVFRNGTSISTDHPPPRDIGLGSLCSRTTSPSSHLPNKSLMSPSPPVCPCGAGATNPLVPRNWFPCLPFYYSSLQDICTR